MSNEIFIICQIVQQGVTARHYVCRSSQTLCRVLTTIFYTYFASI